MKRLRREQRIFLRDSRSEKDRAEKDKEKEEKYRERIVSNMVSKILQRRNEFIALCKERSMHMRTAILRLCAQRLRDREGARSITEAIKHKATELCGRVVKELEKRLLSEMREKQKIKKDHVEDYQRMKKNFIENYEVWSLLGYRAAKEYRRTLLYFSNQIHRFKPEVKRRLGVFPTRGELRESLDTVYTMDETGSLFQQIFREGIRVGEDLYRIRNLRFETKEGFLRGWTMLFSLGRKFSEWNVSVLLRNGLKDQLGIDSNSFKVEGTGDTSRILQAVLRDFTKIHDRIVEFLWKYGVPAHRVYLSERPSRLKVELDVSI